MRVVPYYAAALALLFIALTARVIFARNTHEVALGTGQPGGELERRARVHANFAEFVPLTLLLLVMTEVRGTPVWLVHVLCIALLAGRLLHAWGVSQVREDFRFRTAGMACTLTVLAVAAVALIIN